MLDHNDLTANKRYCIALHPICDAEFKHVGDELLYRAYGGALKADITDPLVATARACSAAFYEIGLYALVGDRQLFLNVSVEWLAQPDLMPLPADQVVIELPDCEIDTQLWQHIESAKTLGYRIAASADTILSVGDKLADLIDIVKVDVRAEQAFDTIEYFRSHNLTLLAAFIENAEVLNQSIAQGFDLLQGYFYAIPEQFQTQAAIKRQGNRAADMRLIRELYAQEVDIGNLQSLIVQDPHLCTLLFKQVNSASDRRMNTISSVSQAIMLMGFEKMRALVATLLLANNEPVKRLLVFKLLIRASLAKRLATRVNDVDPEIAFTCGLFSLMHQLEGLELSVLLAESGLDSQITEALLQHKGDLGKIIKVIESFESARMERRSLKLVEALNREYLASVAWAQEMMSLTQD
ncbi:EAL and HDOD domain-containing protein [Nitrincola sp.]|uniref:EAL and HDOD domain-containing protein n=1 Tax=Nitrincola sp. TaxID=1926584 RepID=UPI003A935549